MEFTTEDNYSRSMEEYNFTDRPPSNRMNYELIRVKIFLSIGLCVGIPAVAWALRLLFLHVHRGGRVSIFAIFLLLSDILELFLIPFVALSLVSDLDPGSQWLSVIFPGKYSLLYLFVEIRLCGLCFHQLVALQSILSLRNPRCFTCLSSPFCSILICLTVWICSVTYLIEIYALYILFAVAVVASVLTCVFTIAALQCCFCSGETNSTAKGTDLCVLAMAMGTLWFLYVPFTVFHVTSKDLSYIFMCLMSFRVVADPLQCVLVCRKISQRRKTQRGIELNTVQTSD